MKRREFILCGTVAGLAFATACSRNRDDEEPQKAYTGPDLATLRFPFKPCSPA